MRKKLLNKHWVGIDVGTSKICVLIAGLDHNGNIEILGIGQHPSVGLKKGVVVDINSTIKSIKKAVESAENMAGIKVDSAVVGISGGHIQAINSQGVVAIKHGDVSQYDIDRVIDAAKAVAIPQDREILHILPQYFKIDGQELIKDSMGMKGIRLEAQVHIITGSISSASNLIKCCEDAGISVEDIVLETIASADATLSEDERELGVGMVDIGAGTSDFAIYKDGKILHSKVVPVAGNHFTRDLAIAFRIPLETAEFIKRKYGAVSYKNVLGLIDNAIKVDVGPDLVKQIKTTDICDILMPRAEEMLEFIFDEIIKFNLKRFMPFGLVLTGGGSMLSGMKELAENMFGMPVRIGFPQNNIKTSGLEFVPDLLKSPIYSTGYGLLLYASKDKDLTLAKSMNEKGASKVFKRMKSWIYDLF
ncbi:TPA: cell division protein FtsA [Candidatus Dependentiae bacterium]|nr:MAG: Cell division protein ftsA [candidate division TM6 bacterium GW2011_GWE2_31_21]KKP53187.1 MAG: Cell division protein ftsA [candidate division TM6 bacterium GW2011_GWF2_33_332]HBS48005.1 cell division protein FtsA [Candidatus Dependentiae bacterium]HBZ73391.1 cell division protein FtsA [Candidatus Dependentiae bacterium]